LRRRRGGDDADWHLKLPVGADTAVHQMRMATRRLRSTLQSFGQIIRRDSTRRLAAEVKWLGAVPSETHRRHSNWAISAMGVGEVFLKPAGAAIASARQRQQRRHD
jgi:CHAD domain